MPSNSSNASIARCCGIKLATTRRKTAGLFSRTSTRTPAPCVAQSAYTSSKNSSPSLLRAPLGTACRFGGSVRPGCGELSPRTRLPSCYLAQLSPDSIKRLPNLIVMKTKLIAAAGALEPQMTANPVERSAALVPAIRAANDLYITGVARLHKRRLSNALLCRAENAVCEVAVPCKPVLGNWTVPEQGGPRSWVLAHCRAGQRALRVPGVRRPPPGCAPRQESRPPTEACRCRRGPRCRTRCSSNARCRRDRSGTGL